MINVTLPDGSVRDYSEETTPLQIAAAISERLANDVIAAEVNGSVVDAMRPLKELAEGTSSLTLKLLTVKDAAALGVLRHSCAHIMARAVMRLFPGTGLAFGPTTGHGFYYDFDLDQRISEDDFPRIEQEMAAIIAEGEPFERFMLSRDEALELCSGMHQALKVEHIREGLAEHRRRHPADRFGPG